MSRLAASAGPASALSSLVLLAFVVPGLSYLTLFVLLLTPLLQRLSASRLSASLTAQRD